MTVRVEEAQPGTAPDGRSLHRYEWTVHVDGQMVDSGDATDETDLSARSHALTAARKATSRALRPRY